MIGAGLPQRVAPLHPVIAGQDILQGIVERMAHMQAARDIGRRDHDRIGIAPGGLVRRAGQTAAEDAAFFPLLIMAGFDFGGIIGFIERHDVAHQLNTENRRTAGGKGYKSG